MPDSPDRPKQYTRREFLEKAAILAGAVAVNELLGGKAQAAVSAEQIRASNLTVYEFAKNENRSQTAYQLASTIHLKGGKDGINFLVRLLNLNGGGGLLSGPPVLVLDSQLASLIRGTAMEGQIVPSAMYKVIERQSKLPSQIACELCIEPSSIMSLNGVGPSEIFDKRTFLVVPNNDWCRHLEVTGGFGAFEASPGNKDLAAKIREEAQAAANKDNRSYCLDAGFSGKIGQLVAIISPCLGRWNSRSYTFEPVTDNRGGTAWVSLLEKNQWLSVRLGWGEIVSFCQATWFPAVEVQRAGKPFKVVDLRDGKTYPWDQWPAEPTPEKPTPKKLGDIDLDDLSDRLDARWRNRGDKGQQAKAKVQEAFLVMWAKKLYTTPKTLMARMAKGEEITEVVIYPELQPDGSTKMRAKPVDLSNPVKIVFWDEPIGYGDSSAQRLRFGIDREFLTIYIYRSSEAIYSSAAVSGVAEALVMIWNNGKSTSRDPIDIFPEFKNLLVALEGGQYLPEIEIIPR